jgi:SHS2 domain-containing protein
LATAHMPEETASHFPHDADLGVRGTGPTRAAAFEQIAQALADAIAEPGTVAPRIAVPIQCEAPDDRILLVDWLNALIFAMATQGLLFSRFEVALTDHQLHATAWGEPIDPARHTPSLEPKGATFAALNVGQQPDGSWLAQCVVDV